MGKVAISSLVFLVLVSLVVIVVGDRGCAKSPRDWGGREDFSSKREGKWQEMTVPTPSRFNLSRSEPQPFDGIPTGLPHFLKSPYVYNGLSINVKGLAVGTKIECPTTGKILTVPHEVGRIAVRAKLDKIVLPELRLIEQTLPEAIDCLREQCLVLDPDGDGVVIRIDEERVERSSPGSLALSNLTLDLTDISLTDALRYVTELAGMKWRLDPDGVVVVPVVYSTPPIETRRYYVPPLAFERFEEDASGSNGAGRGAMEILQSVGIPFADGTSAFYTPSRSELRVSIGGNEHEFVAAWVEALMMEDGGIEKRVQIGNRSTEVREPASDQ